MEPEALGVRLEARVGPSGRVVAQQHAQVGRVQAGGDPRDDVVDLVLDGGLDALGFDVVEEGEVEAEDGHAAAG